MVPPAYDFGEKIFFSYDEPKCKKFSLPSIPFVGNYFHYADGEFKHPDEINQLIENAILIINLMLWLILVEL
jgi:hypothetical protein